MSMSKDDLLFSIIGLLLGFILGFFLTNSFNQRAANNGPTANAPASPTDSPAAPEGDTPEPAIADPQVLAAAQKRANDTPQDFEAQMQAGEIFYRARKYPEAAGFLSKANQLRPDAVEAMVGLGNTYFDDATNNGANDKWPLAEKWYTEALRKEANNVNIRTDLGLTFVFREPPDYDRAIENFRKSLALEPNHLQTLQNLAFSYIKNNNKKEAAATLATLEKTSPDNPALAKLREELGQMK